MKILQNYLYLILWFTFPILADDSDWDAGIHRTEKVSFKVQTFMDGFEIPWGMAFLPDQRLLVTDRVGDLWIVAKDGKGKVKIAGEVPSVRSKGQGGMLDIAVHPDFKNNSYIYISYSDDDLDKKSHTSLIRAKLVNNRLVGSQIIFRPEEKYFTKKTLHFGSRIIFDDDGFIFFCIGDRGDRDLAQDLDMPNGKMYRIRDDGTIPIDNPFYYTKGAIKSIWSYGHRNPQGLAIHPSTRQIWEAEHGPRGGDEVNIVLKGHNYGWPIITYGKNYSGTIISKLTHHQGMDQPIFHWTPSIAVCGIAFYDGNEFPEWKNNLLATSLKFERLHRIELDGMNMIKDEIIYEAGSRVRDVEVGPDGMIYVALEDPGRIVKISRYSK
ncbi:MAG: PQQ-dependent sugar dehydrogenase [Candidatus Neomarinimicrobiota bacterium]|nr:PQQ-dependent sugar dehydrogenase [Candidatus Neomarinimicrobiota bacterium]